jgi:hypothetical protein
MVGGVGRRYDAGKEELMIELTEQQMQALEIANGDSPRFVNPRTKETFVLVPVDEYERLTEGEIDYSPWTREELEAHNWEMAERLGWDEWSEYDDEPEKT